MSVVMALASIRVGIGELAVSANPEDRITTLGLGSCVAVVIVDVVRRVTGMAHVVLPKSEPAEVASKPEAYYTDLAIPRLMQRMARHGSGPRCGPLIVKIVGGAAPHAHSTMGIGKRNILSVKRNLYRIGLIPCAEDVGGLMSRTVLADVGDPLLLVSSPDRDPIRL